MNKNEEYEASYNEFKQLAKSAFRNRDYSTWYIAQFNKKNFVFYNLEPLDQEQKQRIETYLQEMRALDLEEEYLKLPKLIRKELKLLKDFGSFLDKELIEIYRLREAILEAYVNQKNGGFNFDNNINIILNKLYKNLALRSAYHLIDNRKEFFRKALEAILIFLSYKDSQKAPFEKQPKDKSSNVSLSDFIYDLLIYYFDTKDLKTLLDEYYKDRIFDFDTPKKIKNIFINICQRFITLGFYTSSASRFFNNFLILTAHISLKQDIFETIIKHFKEKLEHQIVSINEYENLNYFIVKQWNKNRQNIDFKSLKEIILAYMNLFICGKFNFYTLKIPQQTQTFENMFAILIENKDLFKVDEKRSH